jgi:hypothetical protein
MTVRTEYGMNFILSSNIAGPYMLYAWDRRQERHTAIKPSINVFSGLMKKQTARCPLYS